MRAVRSCHGYCATSADNARAGAALVAPDGRVLLCSEDTPATAFLPHARREENATVRADGEFWRVHVRPGPGGITAQVAQPMEERLELLEEMAENLAWPALGLLALLGLLSWLLIRRLLRPLEDTALRIDAKSPHDLAPVQPIERELKLRGHHLRQPRADRDRCTALLALAPGVRVERALAVPQLRAAPALLASALHNLIDNAARYGREGGRVRIETIALPYGRARRRHGRAARAKGWRRTSRSTCPACTRRC